MVRAGVGTDCRIGKACRRGAPSGSAALIDSVSANAGWYDGKNRHATKRYRGSGHPR